MNLVLRLVVFTVCFCGTTMAKDPELSDEARGDFEWFLALGYPDVIRAPWVEVWREQAPGSSRSMFVQGFLMGSEEGRFSVLRLDLQMMAFAKTMQSPLGNLKVDYDGKSFPKVAVEYLARIREAQADPAAQYRGQFGLRLGMKSQAFFMAYVCWLKGEDELAQKLYDAAGKVAPWNALMEQGKKDEPIKETVARELSHAGTWQAVSRFGASDWDNPTPEPLMSRVELLGAFRDLVRRFPRNPHGDRVWKTIVMLEQMVAEDTGHPARSAEEIARLPVDEQVREWIFQLRDQNGRQFSQPGWCNVFGDFGIGAREGDTPAHQLVKIGYPAVPQLIESLEDKRFSRSVGFSRNHFFSHNVLTVSDCAQQILNHIARRSFPSWVAGGDSTEKAKYLKKYRSEVDEWWRAFQAKGEARSLMEDISSGEYDPRAQIKRLKEIKPEAVEAAVLAGAKNAHGGLLYLEQVGELKSKAGRECLAEFMKSGNVLRIRVEAARQLWMQDEASAIPAMISEWKALPVDAMRDSDWGLSALVQLLIVSGEPTAMNALVENWGKRNVEQRFATVAMFGEVLATEQKPSPTWGKKTKLDAGAVNMAEALLVASLEDTAVYEKMSGSMGDYSFSKPRVCEFALRSLSQAFPRRYVFSDKADHTQRERERFTAVNVWRREHGQVELPMP